MPINPIPLSQLNSNSFFLNLFLLGSWGSGKTTFSLGSQLLRTLHLDIDVMGHISAKSFKGNPHLGIPPIRQDLIMHQPINSIKEMFEAIDWLRKNYKNFDLCVVDTITDLQDLQLNEIRRGKPGYQLKDYEWGPVLYNMQQVTQELKRIPIHVIFNAHETHEKKFDGEKWVKDFYGKFVPNFDGGFIAEWANHFSEIWRYINIPQYYTDNGISQCYIHRHIQTQSDDTFTAKSRVTILEKYEPPILDNILYKINHHLSTNGQQIAPL